jgi:RNA polymerase sigma-70 factor (ECF subfamily)
MTLDLKCFEDIVARYYESLYRFAYSLSKCEADACDLTQETFRQLGAKAHQLREVSKVKSWLFTTLYRAFVDERRHQTRHPHVEAGAVEHELPSVESNPASRIDAATAREALLRLDEVFRVPLTLFHLEDHSYSEIAEILGIPIGTVMSRLSRGRALLRELLEDRGPSVISSRRNPPRTTS